MLLPPTAMVVATGDLSDLQASEGVELALGFGVIESALEHLAVELSENL